jgi:hypothetical protein
MARYGRSSPHQPWFLRPIAAPAAAGGTITLGQLSTGAVSGGSGTHTTAFGTNPAAGNKLIVYIWSHTGQSPTVTDNASTPNTYTKDAEKIDATNNETCHIFRADSILLPSSGLLTITATYVATNAAAMVARELIGAATGAPVTTSVGGPTASSSPATGSFGGTDTGDYFAAVMCDTNGATDTQTQPSGYTLLYNVTDGVNYECGAAVDLITNGPQNPTWAITAGDTWVAAGAAYKAGGSGTQHNQALSVTTTTTPALIKQVGKVLGVSTTTSSSLIKQIGKVLTVTTTTTPSLLKQVGKILSVTTTTTASLVAAKLKVVVLAVTTTTTALILKQVGKVLAVTTTTSPALIKLVSKVLSVTTTTTAALTAVKAKFVTLAVTTTTVPAMVRQVGKSLAVTTTTTPAIVRQIAKTLSLTTTTVASLVASKVKSVVLSVSTTTVAAMTAVLQVSTGGGDLLHQDYLKNYYAAVRLRKAHASDALNALAAAFAADDITDQEFAAAIAALYGDNPNG